MFNLTAIAAKFNVLQIAITRVEEWANCVFVVIAGVGARFVSKKIAIKQQYQIGFALIKLELPELQGSEKQIAWAEKIRHATIENLFTGLFRNPKGAPESFSQAREVALIEALPKLDSATWWIESRTKYAVTERDILKTLDQARWNAIVTEYCI